MYGTFDMVGRTCLGSFANTVCQAAAGRNTSAPPLAVTCGNFTWFVTQSCALGAEVAVLPAVNASMYVPCTCAASATVYALRACTAGTSWGGAGASGGSNCGTATQALGLQCTFATGARPKKTLARHPQRARLNPCLVWLRLS